MTTKESKDMKITTRFSDTGRVMVVAALLLLRQLVEKRHQFVDLRDDSSLFGERRKVDSHSRKILVVHAGEGCAPPLRK